MKQVLCILIFLTPIAEIKWWTHFEMWKFHLAVATEIWLQVLRNVNHLTSELRYFYIHRIAISGPKLNYLEPASCTVRMQRSSVTAGLPFPYWLSQTCCSSSCQTRRADRENSEEPSKKMQRKKEKGGGKSVVLCCCLEKCKDVPEKNLNVCKYYFIPF